MALPLLGLLLLLALLCRPACAFSALSAAPPLFPPYVTAVPGRPASLHFEAEVFDAGAWTPIYVFETTAQVASEGTKNGYFAHLNNWTASWVSSQLAADGALIRVRRVAGAPAIRTAVIHPASAAARVVNVSADGVVTLAASAPARLAVDMDGAMDTVDTGPAYAGPPVHTFAWFVDGALSAGLPDPAAPASIVVLPGDPLPNASSLDPSRWPTVIFAPGVHRAPVPFANNWTVLELQSNTRYFLCAGAVVHAAMRAPQGAANLTVDGFGVVSGEEMVRNDRDGENDSPQGLAWVFVANATVSGVTLVDFPNHHMVIGGTQEPLVSTLRNVKVLGWRANGDGLHVFEAWQVSDLFMRTQDDTMYLDCGKGCPTSFERITAWNDANGCAFLFSAGGGNPEAVVLRDSDVIYARASWAWWSGGRVFGHRGSVTGATMSGVTVDGVRVEDRLPTLNAFDFDMTPASSGSPVHDAAFADISFRNIAVANWSTMRATLSHQPLPYGIPNLMFAAGRNVTFRNIAFANVTIAGQPLDAAMFANPAMWNTSSPATRINVTADGRPLR